MKITYRPRSQSPSAPDVRSSSCRRKHPKWMVPLWYQPTNHSVTLELLPKVVDDSGKKGRSVHRRPAAAFLYFLPEPHGHVLVPPDLASDGNSYSSFLSSMRSHHRSTDQRLLS